MKEIISTENAPAAVGPYSQATKIGNTLFCSGQIPIDPATGKFVCEDVEGQTMQVFKNALAVLEAAGYCFDDVVKVTVMLDDINDFATMNKVYSQHFTKNFPARSAFEVANLPLGAKVEIEMIAAK